MDSVDTDLILPPLHTVMAAGPGSGLVRASIFHPEITGQQPYSGPDEQEEGSGDEYGDDDDDYEENEDDDYYEEEQDDDDDYYEEEQEGEQDEDEDLTDAEEEFVLDMSLKLFPTMPLDMMFEVRFNSSSDHYNPLTVSKDFLPSRCTNPLQCNTRLETFPRCPPSIDREQCLEVCP